MKDGTVPADTGALLGLKVTLGLQVSPSEALQLGSSWLLFSRWLEER